MSKRADLIAAAAAILIHAGVGYRLSLATPMAKPPREAVEVELRKSVEPPPPPPPPRELAGDQKPKIVRAKKKSAAPRSVAPVAAPQPAPVVEAAPAEPIYGVSMESPGTTGLAVPSGTPGGSASGTASKRGASTRTGGGGGRGTLALRTEPKVDLQACGRAAHYPHEAEALGIAGDVHLRVHLDEQGRVQAVTVLSGLGHGLDEAAAEALRRRCKFTPALAEDGRGIPFVIDPYIFHFEMPRS